MIDVLFYGYIFFLLGRDGDGHDVGIIHSIRRENASVRRLYCGVLGIQRIKGVRI